MLGYLKSNVHEVITNKKYKQPNTRRYENYPLVAVEEALANAMYHREYEYGEHIEVSVFSDRIEIWSVPGPLPPIQPSDLAALSFEHTHLPRTRSRNRRVGDFLKLLGYTEGFSTGVNKIITSMQRNGSPMPKFETDKERSYFLVTLYKHKEA